MATEPKKPAGPLPPPVGADGKVIPPENFDNDQRFKDEIDRSPGSIHDHLTQRDKNLRKPE